MGYFVITVAHTGEICLNKVSRYFVGSNKPARLTFAHAASRQQTADSRQQTADSRQQTADIIEQN
jgi:hypothetical protein